jgi:abortive infection bacteriophage resistance protein
MLFSKDSLTFEQQIDRLIERGLQVEDKQNATAYLSHINYYRLGTYWWSFIEDHETHTFKTGATFNQVLNLYVFDRELRLLLLDAIERIEVSLRTQWAFHLSKTYGPHAHLDKEAFMRKFDHQGFIDNLQTEIKRTSDKNIKNQAYKYEEPTPAIWIICEVMSFGWLSRSFDSVARRSLRADISDTYKLKEVVLSSFLHHITTVRNICAHHSRLWNREFTFTMKLPTNGEQNLLHSFNKGSPKQLYNTMVTCAYLMDIISPNNHWKQKLKMLIESHNINAVDMGFPIDWLQRDMWANALIKT